MHKQKEQQLNALHEMQPVITVTENEKSSKEKVRVK